MILHVALIYKDIDKSCYINDGKVLNKVDDSSPYLRISAHCEIIQSKCFSNLKSLQSFSFEDDPNLTTIKSFSFDGCENLTCIDLSSCNKLTTIEINAFSKCYNVTEILLPRGLREVHNYAFQLNKMIMNIIIPASIEIIGKGAFNGCVRLENVIFEEDSNLTSLTPDVFTETNITSFQIPEKVTEVNGFAFSDAKLTSLTLHTKNNNLIIENGCVFSANKSILYFIIKKSTEYTIPIFVSILGSHCFYKSYIRNIYLHNNITTLGQSCFGFTRFNAITIPNSVTSIESSCFEKSYLNAVTIPEIVKSFGNSIFLFCPYLKNVTILSQIDEIRKSLFYGCDKLELINFPNSPIIVNSIHFINGSPNVTMSFTYKTLFSSRAIMKITNITVSYLNKSNLIITRDSLIMDYEQTIIYEFWGFKTSQITIPDSTSKICARVFENSTIETIKFGENSQLSIIEDSAFRNCSKLKSINFPSTTVITIMNNAFESCIILEDISNIYNIPDDCFHGCTKLRNVDIREDSEMIGVQSFENCFSLESINIPSSVKIISDYAFNNCNKLKSIIFTTTNSLQKMSINSISNCESLSNISNFSSDQYKCVSNTLYNKTDSKYYLIYHLCKSLDLKINIDCHVICSYSFNQSINIETISIMSNSVSLIEKFSFNNCDNLKYINFPLCVERVEPFAFNECKSIRCPLIIENTSIEYLKMINESGIPLDLIKGCNNNFRSNKQQLPKLLSRYRKR